MGVNSGLAPPCYDLKRRENRIIVESSIHGVSDCGDQSSLSTRLRRTTLITDKNLFTTTK